MTTTVIYLWGIADDFNNAMIGLFGVLFALSFVAGAFYLASESDGDAKSSDLYAARFKKLLTLGFVSLAAWILIPSSKTIAAMVVIPAIAQSDVIKRDLPEIYSAAVNKLKEELGIKEAEQPK